MGRTGAQCKKLIIPSCPSEGGDEGQHFFPETYAEKLVRDYTGLDFDSIEDLNVLVFDFYTREAVIYNCMQTDSGRDYLQKCWDSQQTEPDRKMLRQYFGKH